MNLPIFSFYLVDQELNLTLYAHVLILLCAAVALAAAAVVVVVVAAAAAVVVVGAAAVLAVHVESWWVNVHLWKFSAKVGHPRY
jgi:hypothetical protein